VKLRGRSASGSAGASCGCKFGCWVCRDDSRALSHGRNNETVQVEERRAGAALATNFQTKPRVALWLVPLRPLAPSSSWKPWSSVELPGMYPTTQVVTQPNAGAQSSPVTTRRPKTSWPPARTPAARALPPPCLAPCSLLPDPVSTMEVDIAPQFGAELKVR
jgi:hypothetical protein